MRRSGQEWSLQLLRLTGGRLKRQNFKAMSLQCSQTQSCELWLTELNRTRARANSQRVRWGHSPMDSSTGSKLRTATAESSRTAVGRHVYRSSTSHEWCTSEGMHQYETERSDPMATNRRERNAQGLQREVTLRSLTAIICKALKASSGNSGQRHSGRITGNSEVTRPAQFARRFDRTFML